MKPTTGWRYRITSGLGVVALVVAAVVVANHPFAQTAATTVPPFEGLEPTTLAGRSLALAVATALSVVVVSMLPLFEPRPRRILDTVSLSLRRVVGASIVLAAVGYYDYTYRLPRTTLVLTTLILCLALPAWFVFVHRRPTTTTDRAVLVGDDPESMADVLESCDLPVVGYVAPAIRFEAPVRAANAGYADGGTQLWTPLEGVEYLGDLSRLDSLLDDDEVDTAILAFERSDRAAFFGALATCHDHDVATKAHHKHADSVLTPEANIGSLIDIQLEPWSPVERVTKRLFDIGFALAGLVVLSPVVLVIAVAIKLDDGGPVFYTQHRTAEFGKTFPVYKFRSMMPHTEDSTPVDDPENHRITRVGRLLRRSHLDEIPQLGSILVGDMSVVGPRAVWIDEEQLLESEIQTWRKRWFVKPGLTGLAQIHDVSSTDPHEKFRYDLQYIHDRSFWFDLEIVIRQVWLVVTDLLETVDAR